VKRSIPIFLILCSPVISAGYSKDDPHALLSQIPLHFEPDGGGYAACGPGYRLAVRRSGLELSRDDATLHGGTLSLRLAGANAGAWLEGDGRLPSSTNYFLGADRARWRTGVPSYARVRLHDVYKGVDLVVYGSQKSLEFDFDVAPGASPRAIRIEVGGSVHTRIVDGALVLDADSGEARWSKPAVYQTVAGVRRPVPGRFVLEGRGRVRFEVGAYDRALPLVIDPVLSFSTYFGNTNNEAARGVAVDGAGNIYIAGYTTSRNLPVSATAVQPAYGGDTMSYQTGDGFVAKFTATGSLAAMTYLGGSKDDLASSLAVDSAGNVYVTGYTNSTDFPVTSKAYQQHMAGEGGNGLFTVGDAFVVKLNSSLSQMAYSTYLGGSLDEAGVAIAIDASGSAYVTGITLSSNFPVTTGAVQPTYHGSGGQPVTDFNVPFFVTGDAFVSKLSPDGSQLVFSTYLGGTLDDAPSSIAVDPSGNVYVAGFTISRDFPVTATAAQTTYKGAEPQNAFYHLGDGFIAKLNPAGTALLYSTFLGGSGDDAVTAIAVDASGSLYATGATSSVDFPVTGGGLQKTYAGPLILPFAERIVGDAFVVKLKPDGSGLVYSTYLGGGGDDAGHAIAVDLGGNVFVAGSTASGNFPITPDAAQKTLAGAGGEHNNGDLIGDGFLAVLNAAGTREVFGTFLGGSLDDSIEGLAIDAADNIVVTGVTMSANFPVTSGAYQSKFGGVGPTGRIYGDAFLARLSAPSFGAISAAPASISVSYSVGAPKPPASTLAVSSSSPASFKATTSGETWLTVTPASGQTPASLTVTIDLTGLAANTYSSTITITATTPGISPLTVPVTLTVGGVAGGPVFTAAGLVNAASALGGPIAPGEMIVLYGSNMGPATLALLQVNSASMITNTLAGTQVLFGTVAAPLIYTSAGQLSAMVPYEVAGQSSVAVQVVYNGVPSGAVTVPVTASSPALFTTNERGTGQAAVLNQDNSYNSDSNPASAGSVIQLFGTGEGQITPPLADGTQATSTIPAPVLPVSVTIGGQPATVQYKGTAPGGVVGFLQINAVVPAGLPPGDVPVVITIGNAGSPANVTVAVH